MSTLLQIERLEAAYGDSQVLFGVDLEIRVGEVVALLGRNGMGKTTTVRAITGTAGITGGSIRFRGERIDRASADRIGRLGIAVVPEGRQIFPNLTVRENLVAFAATRNRNPDPWTLAKVYAFFPQLEARAQHLGNQLSGGEQQMLAIGRALMTNPHLLILDDPTEGLAPLLREEIWKCLAALRPQGQTILVIDKHVQRLIDLADRHAILERGRVAWQGTSAQLGADYVRLQRYLSV